MELHIRDLLSLEYHGDKVANGQLRAKDVAKYISAIDDFMAITTKHAYGKDAELTFDVSGFRNQSFDIDFALQVINLGAAAMFASGSPKDLIMLATDCIKACIHLQGQQPKEVQKDTVDKSVHVTNQQGDTQVFHIETINVIADPKAANSLDCFIREPLSKGLEAVKVKSSVHKIEAHAAANECDYFKPIDFEIPLFTNSIKTGLVIESPSFKDGNKWKFSDGQSSFYAEITDEQFLERVDNGEERFGKNDILLVEMDVIQTQTPTCLKVEKIITKVIDHQYAQKQNSMF
ncbi:hypothetical protein ABVZ07_002604 [Vibrio parahaemolyticus]|nr:hypothetical protein [Vibrio parahaemolyticus]